METAPGKIENHFRLDPAARAAVDTLVREGCDEQQLLHFVVLLWQFKWTPATKAPDWKPTPALRRKKSKTPATLRGLGKHAAFLAASQKSGMQLFVDIAEGEADLKRLRELKASGNLLQSGSLSFRPGYRSKRKVHVPDARRLNLSDMAEQLAAAVPILERAASIRFNGVGDLIQKQLLTYIENQTGRAHYAELADLFPQAKKGEGPFSQTALRQWRYDKRDLFASA